MAAHFKPKKCPECGSAKIIKDRVIGQHTGDWKCVDCWKVFSKFETEEWQSRNKSQVT
jgi:DNA-directed RNA polymerase subunit RPC12/RpoP